MKISTRLSIAFSLITSCIFIVFGVTVYIFSANYRERDFEERLKERVIITEKLFLEKDTFSPKELETITNQFLHTLPEETEEVVEMLPGKKLEFQYDYPIDVKENLSANTTFSFQSGNMQGSSRIFQIGGKDYLIIVTAIDQIGLQNLRFLKNVIILLMLIGIPLIFFGSFFITRMALLPVSKKIDEANSIDVSNLHQRLQILNPRDELGKMAIAFNKLLDRLEAAFQSQKSFIRNASHEIRNPLTAILGEAEIAISKSRTHEEYVQSLKTIISEADNLNSTVNNLLQLSKVEANEENVQFKTIELDKLLFDTKTSYDFLNADNQIHLIMKENGTWKIKGNQNLLKSALINVFDNASKYSNNQPVEVEVSKVGHVLQLRIADHGIGILKKDLERIKTPFFRGNNAMKIKGSGIGLSLSAKIIQLHRGVLEIESQIDVGTNVIIKLPLIE